MDASVPKATKGATAGRLTLHHIRNILHSCELLVSIMRAAGYNSPSGFLLQDISPYLLAVEPWNSCNSVMEYICKLNFDTVGKLDLGVTAQLIENIPC